jgi:hypothetical protein
VSCGECNINEKIVPMDVWFLLLDLAFWFFEDVCWIDMEHLIFTWHSNSQSFAELFCPICSILYFGLLHMNTFGGYGMTLPFDADLSQPKCPGIWLTRTQRWHYSHERVLIDGQ